MSQASNNLGSSEFLLNNLNPVVGSPAKRESLTEEEKSEVARLVRERKAKYPDPQWRSKEDILKFIENFDHSKEGA